MCVGACAATRISEFSVSDHKIRAEGVGDVIGNVGRILNLRLSIVLMNIPSRQWVTPREL